MSSIGCYARYPLGTPFFKNYPSKVYGAHNRNFDIMCDDRGYVYVANFEGLLIYDYIGWKIMHTPGISRVTELSRDEKGRVWFSGINVEGCIQDIQGDSVKVFYTKSDKYATKSITLRSKKYDDIDRWNGIEVYKRLKISADRTLLATASAGVIAIDADGNEVWSVNEEKGLCSNSINMIDYDGKGTVWGATDNGIFCISVSEVYTYFGQNEGLHGQVTCIAEAEGRLFVGTLQGLYYLKDGRFEKLDAINQACWQLAETVKKNVIAATTNGVFTYGVEVTQKSDKMSLSVLVENDESYLSGELDGIYRRWYDDRWVLLDSINNVIKMQKDDKGDVWALTLGGEHYYKPAKKEHFTRLKKGTLSQLLEYTDDKGEHWHCNDDGMGLVMEGMPDDLAMWLRPFSKYSIQAMYVNNGIVWIGGSFGLIRFDIDLSQHEKPVMPHVYLRNYTMSDRSLYAAMANDKQDAIGETMYSFRLHHGDAWSRWSGDQDIDLHNLAYGFYQLSVRSIDPFGNIAVSEEQEFLIRYPVYMRWYALIFYVFVLALIVVAIFKYRTRVLRHRQEALERVVTERTQEVVKQKNEIEIQKNEIENQKNEIEEKSNRLETTLTELRETQNELVRKEKEATVGKLTQGLIDRILNPMNYINNFSHLTLGLTKDLRQDLDDEASNMNADTYEDCVDVLNMMTTNLEKIEQHGLSTTRILKAMEEMMKERSNKLEPMDQAMLCDQAIEVMRKYYATEIQTYNISVEWDKPELPIVADVNPELMTRVMLSMLYNSMYAVMKKADKLKQKGEDYQPTIRLTIIPETGEVPPFIEIYDNGTGIEEGIVEKVFDPFFTTKPTSEAPGVGLYMSQQIIQDFGGSIKVESEKDIYTKFIISLP